MRFNIIVDCNKNVEEIKLIHRVNCIFFLKFYVCDMYM